MIDKGAVVDRITTTVRAAGLCTVIGVVGAACGGGGSAGPSPSSSPPPQAPSPPRTANNHPADLVQPNPDQRALTGRPFSYDVSQGGTTFTDPDGDRLSYTVYWPLAFPPAGLSVSGSVISGVPTETGYWEVGVSVDDGLSISDRDSFVLRVDENSPPVLVYPNQAQLVAVGEALYYDATQSGSAFVDPDGDAVTYQVAITSAPHGLSIAGSQVIGAMDEVAVVRIEVTAADAYGGRSSDVFAIAAPGPEPGAPALPDPSFVYADEGLELPFTFRSPTDDSQPEYNRTTDAGATLGRVLFYDKRLSITNTFACSSCHHQDTGFTASERFGQGVLGVPMKRNTMSLANVRYNNNRAWFSDMRVELLEELALQPIEALEELGSPLDLVESKLRATEFYPPLFQAAFGTSDITRERIGLALAQFLQALISYRTKFDRAYNPMTNVPPDPGAVLDAREMRGLAIFTDEGRGLCNMCHGITNQAMIWQANNGLDEIPQDPGILNEALRRNGSIGMFRAASLRNIAVTGPYMHDGRFSTLREVIEHYDHGIKDSPNLDILLRRDEGPLRLNLSEEDKDALEALLNTFTDEPFLSDSKFSDPFQ